MTTFSRSGFVTGTTGVALNVSLGFAPDYVRLINESDGEEIYWNREMTNLGTPIFGTKTVAAGTRTILATAAVGVSDFAGVDGVTDKGFTIGATAGVNIDTEEITWEAGHYDDPDQ